MRAPLTPRAVLQRRPSVRSALGYAALVAALTLLGPAALVGCDSAGSGGDAGTDVVSNEEAAVAVANAVAYDAGGALDAVAAAAELPGFNRPGGDPEPGCERTRTFDPATTTWTRTVDCERASPNGPFFARFGRTQTFRFFAGGVAQQDPATADSLHFAIVDGYGERRTPVLRHLLLAIGGDFDVAALDADTATVNGAYDRSATDTLRVRRPGRNGGASGQRTLIYDLALQFDDVTVVHGADGRRGRPVGGSVSGTMEGTATFTGPNGQTRTHDFSRSFTITFGSSDETGLITVGGQRFRADLRTGTIVG